VGRQDAATAAQALPIRWQQAAGYTYSHQQFNNFQMDRNESMLHPSIKYLSSYQTAFLNTIVNKHRIGQMQF